MDFFEISCHQNGVFPAPKYSFVYAYAARTFTGTILSLIFQESQKSEKKAISKIALVQDGLFSVLADFVKEHQLAIKNDQFHVVNGLPGGLGGSVEIHYRSGETIHFQDNQSPVISPDAGDDLVKIFRECIENNSLEPKKSTDIQSVSYFEDRREMEFSRYTLQGNCLMNEDRYGEAQNLYFKKETVVSEDTMLKIREMVDEGLLLNWQGLSRNENGFYFNQAEKVTFTLTDGTITEIDSRMRMPGPFINTLFQLKQVLQFK